MSLIIVLDRTGIASSLQPITGTLYAWGILLAAFSLLLGVFNAGWVHLQRIFLGDHWPHSVALVAALVVVLASGLLSLFGG